MDASRRRSRFVFASRDHRETRHAPKLAFIRGRDDMTMPERCGRDQKVVRSDQFAFDRKRGEDLCMQSRDLCREVKRRETRDEGLDKRGPASANLVARRAVDSDQ